MARDAFQSVNLRDYHIEIATEGDTYCCVVNHLTSSNKYTIHIPGTDHSLEHVTVASLELMGFLAST